MYGVCTDAATYDEISPHTICPAGPTGGSACCSTPEECPEVNPEPPEPPGPGDISVYNCGIFFTWGECEGLDYKTIPNGQQCSDFPNECCIDLNDCRTIIDDVVGDNEYYCDTSTGTCIEKCTTGYESNCSSNTYGLCTGPTAIPLTCIRPGSDHDGEPGALAAYKLCSQAGDKYNKCNSCLNANGIWTAFGCIPFTPKSLIEKILPIAVGVAGAISLLIMLMGVLFITTSSGNPDNLQKGKEIITAAITGLLFIIFSIVLLNLIGVEILQIPGF